MPDRFYIVTSANSEVVELRGGANGDVLGNMGLLAEDARPAIDDEIFYVAYTPGGNYTQGDAGIVFLPGGIEFHGAAAQLYDLIDPTAEQERELRIDRNGRVYAVDIIPGWEEYAEDPADYDLGGGTGPGPWSQITGTAITIPNTEAPGTQILFRGGVWVENDTIDRTGTIEIGWSLNGADPALVESINVSPGMDAAVVRSNIAVAGVTAGQIYTLAARRTAGSHPAFGVHIRGTKLPSSLYISKS